MRLCEIETVPMNVILCVPVTIFTKINSYKINCKFYFLIVYYLTPLLHILKRFCSKMFFYFNVFCCLTIIIYMQIFAFLQHLLAHNDSLCSQKS